MQLALLAELEEIGLRGDRQLMEAAAMPHDGFRIQRQQRSPPGLARRRQPQVAIAVARILGQLRVEHGRHGHLTGVASLLREDAGADGAHRGPLDVGEEDVLVGVERQTLVDHMSGLLVP